MRVQEGGETPNSCVAKALGVLSLPPVLPAHLLPPLLPQPSCGLSDVLPGPAFLLVPSPSQKGKTIL